MLIATETPFSPLKFMVERILIFNIAQLSASQDWFTKLRFHPFTKNNNVSGKINYKFIGKQYQTSEISNNIIFISGDLAIVGD